MSKFSIKVELQSLKIEVEGSREDAPRLAQKVGEQIGNLVKPAMLLEVNRSQSADPNHDDHTGDERRKPARGRRAGSGGGGRSSAEDITLSIDPSIHGSPRQEWNTAQKAIWFLNVVRDTQGDGLSAYSIAKAFNKHFKSAGVLNPGNASRDLEKERLKGTGATVGANTNDGAAKYFLTDAGVRMAEKLIKGDAAKAATAD